ncbi:MAG TPA: hypothetical protein DDW52_23300 [Planctomycetaceae bacterium]|nr:hypothetical protein [Planctomycetaceae bacterium]
MQERAIRELMSCDEFEELLFSQFEIEVIAGEPTSFVFSRDGETHEILTADWYRRNKCDNFFDNHFDVVRPDFTYRRWDKLTRRIRVTAPRSHPIERDPLRMAAVKVWPHLQKVAELKRYEPMGRGVYRCPLRAELLIEFNRVLWYTDADRLRLCQLLRAIGARKKVRWRLSGLQASFYRVGQESLETLKKLAGVEDGA